MRGIDLLIILLCKSFFKQHKIYQRSEMSSMRGWRGRIGLIMPDDGINDDEYWNYLPEGVTILNARFTTKTRDDDISVEMVKAYSDLKLLGKAADVIKIT